MKAADLLKNKACVIMNDTLKHWPKSFKTWIHLGTKPNFEQQPDEGTENAFENVSVQMNINGHMQ